MATAKSRPAGGIPRLKPGYVPLLSYGFRPFFLGAGAWAALAMILWIGLLAGAWSFAGNYGAVAWHAHEFLFGYVSAVVTGFLLTAIPNWTGRLPVQGTPLLALFLLWLAGRIAMLLTDRIGVAPAAVIDAAFLVALAGVILLEIITGRNWRNLVTVLLVSALATANICYHLEVVYSGAADYGIRIGAAAIVGLIMLIGGRITPSFTRNWLARQAPGKLPTPFNRFDLVTLAVTAAALVFWIALPERPEAGALLIVAGLAQAARLARWAGERTWREPLLVVLHIGYAFVPLGALMLALSVLRPDLVPPTAALHAWTTGAVGVMTLAVMTRATLGHTGRALHAGRATIALYAAVIVAVFARIAAPLVPAATLPLLETAGLFWILGFGTFVAVYGPMLVSARKGA